ncbi:MAG: YdeI/OmpD-associated family protein [Candidatus Peribacteraceae bacterium]|nr:YdeI/OmpD-associated family protein [Candidatus Peribacteraceae bacterium]
MPAPELPIIAFPTPKAMEAWLKKHAASSPGIWLRFFKKDSGEKSVTYLEALDVALCYGWIDGQAKPGDTRSWIQRFTPRRPRSIWSKRNREFVARLTEAGRMTPAGQAAIDAAKADGRWDAAYDSPKNMSVPEDFVLAVQKHKKAAATFATLNKANTYAIAWRLTTAKKPETRQRRFDALLAMLKKGEKLH